MEDREIVALYFARSEDAIELTAEKYGARLRLLADRILEDEKDAEECVSETYLAAWNSIPPHEPASYLYPYLARITRHLAIDRCRSRARAKQSLTELTDEMAECIPASGGPEEAADARLLGETIGRWLRTLTAEKRIIFLRRYWYMDTIGDIAQRLGIGQSKVKTTLHRCRKELRAFLEKEGYRI